MSTPARAFTLIELLVVVGIIAILAAIAIPNFLQAHTRAKVSRATADMRTIATALETYRVDNNRYPPDWDGLGPVVPPGEWKTYRHLTTPVAYLTSFLKDPFNIDVPQKSLSLYDYWGRGAVLRPGNAGSAPYQAWSNRPVFWVIYSYGPMGENNQLGGDLSVAVENVYDPTNGTVSAGDIGRSNRGILPHG